MRVRLFPADGSAPVELTRDVVLVGRGEDCALREDHKSVSKRHCVLVRTDGLVLLRDLGSGNGTKLNGEKVLERLLQDGDEIAIGKTKLRFVDELAQYQKAREEAEKKELEQLAKALQLALADPKIAKSIEDSGMGLFSPRNARPPPPTRCC